MGIISKTDLRILWCRACAAASREITAHSFDITPARILSKNRGKAHVSLARQVAMYLTHVVCGITLQDIAVLFRRDRSTASYACKRVEDMRDDQYFDAQLEQLEKRLILRMEKIRTTQLRDQQALLLEEEKIVIGGESKNSLLLCTENGRLLAFKPFQWNA